MIEPRHRDSDLPELERTNDPRGGAAAWALLAVGIALLAAILIAVTWAAGAKYHIGASPTIPQSLDQAALEGSQAEDEPQSDNDLGLARSTRDMGRRAVG